MRPLTTATFEMASMDASHPSRSWDQAWMLGAAVSRKRVNEVEVPAMTRFRFERARSSDARWREMEWMRARSASRLWYERAIWL